MTVRQPDTTARETRWLNRTVLGIGLASLVSDWPHEIAATAVTGPIFGVTFIIGCR